MRRVYVETSVWGMVTPGQNPALRQPTLDFLDQCAARLRLPYISAVVAEELHRADAAIQEIILAKVDAVDPQVAMVGPATEALAERFIMQGVLPPRRLDDARHVACAMVHELDLLVSWNYRHIANMRKAEAFNAIAVLSGFERRT